MFVDPANGKFWRLAACADLRWSLANARFPEQASVCRRARADDSAGEPDRDRVYQGFTYTFSSCRRRTNGARREWHGESRKFQCEDLERERLYGSLCSHPLNPGMGRASAINYKPRFSTTMADAGDPYGRRHISYKARISGDS